MTPSEKSFCQFVVEFFFKLKGLRGWGETHTQGYYLNWLFRVWM